MVAYAPLNVRSHYSFHDSLLPVRTIVARAAELGLPAVGLADSNLHAGVEFFLAAREAGLHPVLGAEVTPAPDRAAPFSSTSVTAQATPTFAGFFPNLNRPAPSSATTRPA